MSSVVSRSKGKKASRRKPAAVQMRPKLAPAPRSIFSRRFTMLITGFPPPGEEMLLVGIYKGDKLDHVEAMTDPRPIFVKQFNLQGSKYGLRAVAFDSAADAA